MKDFKELPGFTDLHMHSICSDGSDKIPELLTKLKEQNVTIFSLTDHDTISGCAEVKKLLPDGMIFFPGVEFSCLNDISTCHVLGYGYDEENEAIQSVLEYGKTLRLTRLTAHLKHLEEAHGIILSNEEKDYLFSLDIAGKPHIARILVEKGIASSITEGIQKYINLHKEGPSKIPAKLAVEGILKAGGIPIWAHPLGGESDKRLTQDEFYAQFAVMKETGILGLECYYSRYSKEECSFLLSVAKEHNMLISGGSDYHGANKSILLHMLNEDNEPVATENLSIIPLLLSKAGLSETISE